MVSVIIPAFNEADTVANSVIAALRHPDITEVLVVDDGSTDATAEVAEAAGARVVRLNRNAGKGAALDAGVRAARHDILLFLDADITGHTRESLSRIINPVLSGRFDMYVGIRARSTYWLNWALHFFPIIGGDRALTRQLWDSVPQHLKCGFQIEIALNYMSKQFERGMGFELISGTRHRIKEQKYGAALGMVRRVIMIGNIVSVSFRLYVLRTMMRKLSILRRSRFARRWVLSFPPPRRLGIQSVPSSGQRLLNSGGHGTPYATGQLFSIPSPAWHDGRSIRKPSMTHITAPTSPPDALLLIGPGCPHCAATRKALDSLVQDGTLGRLNVVDVDAKPDLAAEFSVRSVPWVRLGPFELQGLHSPQELRHLASLAAREDGLTLHLADLLANGQRDQVLLRLRRQPEHIVLLADLIGDPYGELSVRIGVMATLEELQEEGLLNNHANHFAGLAAHPAARVRADACYALTLAGGEEAMTVLRTCTEDPDPDVRETALDGIDALTQSH